MNAKRDTNIMKMTHLSVKISMNVNLDIVVSEAAKMESVPSHVTVQKDLNKEKEKNSVELAKMDLISLSHFSLVKISTNVWNLLLIVAMEFVEIRSEVLAVTVIKDLITS